MMGYAMMSTTQSLYPSVWLIITLAIAVNETRPGPRRSVPASALLLHYVACMILLRLIYIGRDSALYRVQIQGTTLLSNFSAEVGVRPSLGSTCQRAAAITLSS
jgi:hypothetical protein